MKLGANFADRNKIAKLAAEGKSVQEISAVTQIGSAVVEKFMPGAKPKAKPKAKGKSKAKDEPTGTGDGDTGE